MQRPLFFFLFFGSTHLYLTEQNQKKVSGVLSFKHHIGFLITNELWQVCWVATCPILSVMLADSSALFSERRNMWKKLVFYISQLVTSSLPWTLTSHLAPNTPHGKCPHAMALWGSCVLLTIHAKKERKKRIGWKRSRYRTNRKTQSDSNKWSKGVSYRTSQRQTAEQRWRVSIRISSGCITATHSYDIQMEDSHQARERDWTDNLTLLWNENKIQWGKTANREHPTFAPRTNVFFISMVDLSDTFIEMCFFLERGVLILFYIIELYNIVW